MHHRGDLTCKAIVTKEAPSYAATVSPDLAMWDLLLIEPTTGIDRA